MTKKIVREYVKYEFGEEEKKQIAADLAEKIGKANDLDDEKKAMTKDYGGRIDTIQNEIAKLAQNHRQGYDYRNVNCTVEENPKKKLITHRRIDNGEIARTRKMTDDDRQTEIPGM